MLDLAETLDPLLDERGARLESGEEEDEDISETTLQLVFFDGEEAFKDWTATDSIYGARYAESTIRPIQMPTCAGTLHRSGLRPTSTPMRNVDFSQPPRRSSGP